MLVLHCPFHVPLEHKGFLSRVTVDGVHLMRAIDGLIQIFQAILQSGSAAELCHAVTLDMNQVAVMLFPVERILYTFS